MQVRNWLAILLAGMSICGCATSSEDLAPTRPDRAWIPKTSTDGEIIAGQKPSPSSNNDPFVLPVNATLTAVDDDSVVDSKKTYDLAELIDLAQTHNTSTCVAWNRAKEAALAVGVARSAYLPRLSVGAVTGYRHGTATTPGPLDTSLETKTSGRGDVASLSLEWLLFDFGQRTQLAKVAEQTSTVSNIAFTLEHQRVIYEVSLAYYAYNAARARAWYADQSFANSREIEKAAESRLKQGVGTVVDVAQAHQATAQGRLASIQAQGATRDTYLSLLSAVGLSPVEVVKISDISDRKVSIESLRPLEATIRDALGRRPDVLAAYSTAKASDAAVRAAAAEFLPKVFLAATGSYSAGDLGVTAIPSIGEDLPTVNVGSHNSSAAVMLGVRMPLYDAGTRAAAMKQAQARAATANMMVTRTKEDAARQIAAADNALRTAVAAYAASAALVNAAQTTYASAFAAYKNGVGSVTTAGMAETGLLQAKIARVEALSASLSAAATLALAIGGQS